MKQLPNPTSSLISARPRLCQIIQMKHRIPLTLEQGQRTSLLLTELLPLMVPLLTSTLANIPFPLNLTQSTNTDETFLD